MNRSGYPLIAAIVAFWGLHAFAQEKGAGPEEHPEDWVSPDTLAAAVYSIASGPAGEVRDCSSMVWESEDDSRPISPRYLPGED